MGNSETREQPFSMSLNKRLANAAERGNLELVKSLIKQGASVCSVDEEGWSPLMHAVGEGHANVAVALIAAGASVAARTHDGSTLLHLALCGSENVSLVSYLVDVLGVTIDEPNADGWTPLMLAVHVGHEKIVRFLLLRKANWKIRLPDGRSILDISFNERIRELIVRTTSEAAVPETDNNGDFISQFQEESQLWNLSQRSSEELISLKASIQEISKRIESELANRD